MTAGPNARAGFIMAPVKFPPTSAATKIASPIPKPPIFGASEETAVPNTALTRKNVSSASIQTPCRKVTSPARRGPPPSARLTAARGSTPLTRAAPTSAPRSWARMYCEASRPSILFTTHTPGVSGVHVAAGDVHRGRDDDRHPDPVREGDDERGDGTRVRTGGRGRNHTARAQEDGQQCGDGLGGGGSQVGRQRAGASGQRGGGKRGG